MKAMKEKLLALLFAFCIITLSCTNHELEDPYIKFKYAGPQDKPIPQAVFFPNSISKEIIGFGSGFHITSAEFENIKKAIQQNHKLIRLKVLNDSAIGGLYNFYIIENSNNLVYYSNEKQIIDTMFSAIQSQLIDSTKRKSVKQELENIYRRLN